MAGMHFPLLDDRYIFQTKPVELEMPPKRRLSEGSDGGEEEEAVGHIEEEEKVRVGPGRPKKKKIDPTQQMQVSDWSCRVMLKK